MNNTSFPKHSIEAWFTKSNNSLDTWHVSRYICDMIASLRHKGLRLYYEKGDASKLQPQHVGKLRLILTRLNAAKVPNDINVPGYNLHQLTGDLKNFWAVKVDKNYRVVFRFEGEDVYDVDYIDYH